MKIPLHHKNLSLVTRRSPPPVNVWPHETWAGSRNYNLCNMKHTAKVHFKRAQTSNKKDRNQKYAWMTVVNKVHKQCHHYTAPYIITHTMHKYIRSCKPDLLRYLLGQCRVLYNDGLVCALSLPLPSLYTCTTSMKFDY